MKKIGKLWPLAVLPLLGACHETVGSREESLGPGVHRLTVDLAGDEPAEFRLAKDADAVCPAGYSRQEDETMPPDAPHYRVWLIRCK
jgi:hypothetical protein